MPWLTKPFHSLYKVTWSSMCRPKTGVVRSSEEVHPLLRALLAFRGGKSTFRDFVASGEQLLCIWLSCSVNLHFSQCSCNSTLREGGVSFTGDAWYEVHLLDWNQEHVYRTFWHLTVSFLTLGRLTLGPFLSTMSPFPTYLFTSCVI